MNVVGPGCSFTRNTSGLLAWRISCRPRRTSTTNASPGVLVGVSSCRRNATNGRTCRSRRAPLNRRYCTQTVFWLCDHHDGFFEHDVVELERPHRDAMIETELLQIAVRIADEALVLELGAAEVQLARRRDHGFVAARDHDVPALRCRQVRHEQAVILARRNAGNRAGGVAAETVRDQPFAAAQLQRIAIAVPAQHDLPAVDHARPSTSSIALCAGSRHSPSPASATSIVTPWPP